MSLPFMKTFLIGACLGTALFSLHAIDFTIAENGKVRPLIINASKTAAGEQAVSELTHYIQKISGVQTLRKKEEIPAGTRVFRILLADTVSPQKEIVLPPEIVKKFADSKKEDPFYIKTLSPDTLLIAGKTPRAVLYGACFFLDRYLGVRWFYPGPQGESVPRNPVVRIPSIDDFQEPFTDLRCARYTGHKMKNVPWTPDDVVLWEYRNLGFIFPYRTSHQEELKTIEHIELPGQGHSCFDSAVSGTLYPEHPEYFPLIDGKRVRCRCRTNELGPDGKPLPWVQRCVSNPEVKERMVDHIIRQIDRNPSGTFGMGAADVKDVWCRCPECNRMGTLNGEYSASNLYFRFYKEVSDEVLKKRPDAKLWVYIYLDYRTPPADSSFKFDPRVNAIYYAHGRCIAHPIDDPACEINRPFYQEWQKWGKVFSRVGLCDYYGNSNTPYCPNEYNYAADAPARIRHNDWGEREHITAERFYLNWQFYYVKMKLWWNPKLDINGLMEDCYTRYYGTAAAPMKQFHELKRLLWKNAPGHAWYPGPRRGAYCLALPESEKEMRKYLAEAEKSAKGDKLLLARLSMEKDAFLKTWVADAAETRNNLAEKRVVPILRARGKITIDGRLDEPEWKKVEGVTHFLSPYTGSVLREDTTLRVLYDDANFYVAVECMNDKAWTPLKAAERPRDDGRIASEDDSVEVFLCTPDDGLYYQFMVNSLGSYCDSRMLDKSFDSKCEVKTAVLPDRYIVEMRIPVAPMGIGKIRDGSFWRCHVWRNLRNLQPPETTDRGGIDGKRPHSITDYRPMVPGGCEIIRNGSFRLLDAKGKPEGWGISTPDHFSIVEVDGQRALKLSSCKIYQFMRLSETGHFFDKGHEPCFIEISILASGKGSLEFFSSTGFPPQKGEPFTHKRQGSVMTSPLTPEKKEHRFRFELKKGEHGYLFIGARDALIYQVSAVRSPKD